MLEPIRQSAATRSLRVVFAMLLLLITMVWLVQPALAASAALPDSSERVMSTDAFLNGAAEIACEDGDGINDSPNCASDDLKDLFVRALGHPLSDHAGALPRDEGQHAVQRMSSETFRPPIADPLA